jgi:hypothetical protein
MRSLLIRAFPRFLGSVFLAASSAGQGVPRLDSYKGVAVRILQSKQIVAKIKTGARPARISTAILPPDRVTPHQPEDRRY